MAAIDGLNPAQQQAVLHDEGPLVVFAGAGSGKTRVITHRIARLVTERRVPPWRILAVTFTNKAAQEMRERLARLVSSGARDLWVGTFHAICARLLRRHAKAIGIKSDFTIYDDADQRVVVTQCLKELGLDEKRYPPKQVAGSINRAKQEIISAAAYQTDNPYAEQVQAVYRLYEAKLEQYGALDFGDLIYQLVAALEADPELLTEVAGRFSYILVDEYQDTNHAQFRLVTALAAGHQNLCVVGDDDQSIYRWRGADRRNILDFRKHFPGATIVKLEQNYRSTKRILRAAHAIIRGNHDREPKELWTENDEGARVIAVRCEDERDEAQMLVQAVRQLAKEQRSLEDMVVFYRTHAQARVLEEGLRYANIPYRVIGGPRFYDRKEIKDLLAYLRVVHNPDDDVSLLRIINVPTRGIGKTTVERLLDFAAQNGIGLFEAMRRVGEVETVKAKTSARIRALTELLEGFRARVADGATLDALAHDILDRTGYAATLSEEETPEALVRTQNLSELIGAMTDFEREAEEPTLAAFLELVTLQTSADEADADAKLTLMTVHAAKGLEFPVVVVTGLEEELFPLRSSNAIFESVEEMEEERRLAYVAFTRAEERLILSYATRRILYGQLKEPRPSRFLTELPRDDVTLIGGEPVAAVPSGRRVGTSGPRGSWGPPSRSRRPSHPPRRPAPSTPPGESYVDRSEAMDEPVHLGMRVRHKKFGVGTVAKLPYGSPPRLQVDFPGWGIKTLQPTYLEPV